MADAAGFADLSGAELLDRVDVLHECRRRAEVDILVAAAEFAVQHGEGSVDLSEARRPARQQLARLGGEGTPAVAEFAPVVFGCRLGLSSWAGRSLFADVLDLRWRLPNIWAALLAGDARVQHARFVARRTRELSPEAAGYVDLRLAASCDGAVSWARFEELVQAAVKAADVAAAFAREQAAARRRFARATRSTEEGMRGFYVRADFAAIARIEATVVYLAQALAALGDERCEDDRRVAAVLLMANPPEAMRLLRAYAARRARHSDDPLAGLDPDPQPPGPEAEPGAAEGPEPEGSEPEGPLPSESAGSLSPETKRFRPASVAPAPSTDFELDYARLLPAVWLFVHLASGPQHAGPDTGSPRDSDAGGTGFGNAGFAEQALDTGAVGVAGFPPGREPPPADLGRLARIEGLGPMSTEWVRRVLGRRCRFKVTPVLDPLGLSPVDGYEIPAVHRAAVHAMTPADVFPFAAHTGRARMQIDHTIPYDHAPDPASGRPPPAQSRIGNYGPLTAFHHRVKTHGDWQVAQPFPGIYLWRDPYGAVYLVDPTGTRRIGVPERSAARPDRARAPDRHAEDSSTGSGSVEPDRVGGARPGGSVLEIHYGGLIDAA